MGITLLDGAVGTTLWGMARERGIKEVPVWQYNMTHPDMVQAQHKKMLEAGAQMILTNTFGVNRITAGKTPYQVADAVKKGVELALDVRNRMDSKAVVALACGPLPELLEPYGDLEEEQAAEYFDEVLSAGVQAGAEAIILQTFIDLEMMKIAAKEAKKHALPLYCTLSFEKVGKTMMGQSVEDVCEALAPLDIQGIGMNCSLGPDLALPVIRRFAQCTQIPLVFKPNGGMPGQTVEPEAFAQTVSRVLDIVSYVGGCCNCDERYIAALKKYLI